MRTEDANVPLLTETYDVLVYGGTVAGVAAALAAARMGCRTVLLERGRHFGGMTASGLGSIDTTRTNAFGGIFNEFLELVRRHYIERYGPDSEQYRLTYGGFFMEPHVAGNVLNEMLAAQSGLTCMRGWELERALVDEHRLQGAGFRERSSGRQLMIRAQVCVDATYEGDLAARAGVDYRVGREGRSEYGEQYAGVIYYDWRYTRRCLHPASTGEASPNIQANCFRVTLTDDPAKRIPFSRPENYADFLPLYRTLAGDCAAGRVRFLSEVLWLNRLANRKYCVNGQIEALTSLDLAGPARRWPEATCEERDRLYQLYVGYTQGLFYYLQNDPAVPRIMREEASCFGLPPDEYPDNNHFPWQLYVRQGRRIKGAYLLTESDSVPLPGQVRPAIHRDAIGIYEHSFDSHACCDRLEPGAVVRADDGFELIEGVIWFRSRNQQFSPNRPATIPYRAILPERLDGLLVPSALSATNVAFSSIRMEPAWMATGHAAGVAAALAVRAGVPPRQVPIGPLQAELVAQRQVLVYFDDLRLDDPEFAAIQLHAVTHGAPTFAVASARS
ncbi:MAG: FAD-dependent oxidoreductase [bacterium]